MQAVLVLPVLPVVQNFDAIEFLRTSAAGGPQSLAPRGLRALRPHNEDIVPRQQQAGRVARWMHNRMAEPATGRLEEGKDMEVESGLNQTETTQWTIALSCHIIGRSPDARPRLHYPVVFEYMKQHE